MSLQAEGPWEPGTIALVDAETDVNLHYGGITKHITATAEEFTNIGRCKPGMRVKKRWFPSDEPTGEGLIVAVELTDHPYGPIVHVLWSVEPRRFGRSLPKPKPPKEVRGLTSITPPWQMTGGRPHVVKA